MILATMGAVATSAAEVYWMALYGGSAAEQEGTGAAVASDNSVFMSFRSSSAGAGALDAQTIQISTAGSLLLQRSLGTVNNENGLGVAAYSNGNFYVVGNFGNPTQGDAFVAKYNSAGTVQWQRGLDPGSTGSCTAYEVGVDSSENVFLIMWDGQADSMNVAKYDSAGTLSWQRRLSGTNTDVTYGGRVTTSGDVFICGYTRSGSVTNNAAFLAKYNTSGTIQWQTHLYTSGKNANFYDVAVDTSGNIYAVGDTDVVNANSDILIAKFNSSGTVQWQRRFGDAARPNAGFGITTDSANNVYVCGHTWNASNLDQITIVKYNTSGTLQWQRRVRTPTGTNTSYQIKCDSRDNIIVFGYSTGAGAGSADCFIMKIPNDGTLTGTYSLAGVNFTYDTPSFSDNATTLTQAATSLTDAAGALTSSTSTLTSNTPSLTYSSRTIP